MNDLSFFKSPIGIISALVGLIALIAAFWNMLEITDLEVTAYCKVDGFIERKYSSFKECDATLEKDIEKYGYVCGCRRTDGINGPVSKVAMWIF